MRIGVDGGQDWQSSVAGGLDRGPHLLVLRHGWGWGWVANEGLWKGRRGERGRQRGLSVAEVEEEMRRSGVGAELWLRLQ